MTADSPFWRGRPVAVTGATGFVGYHLARRLQDAGADVVALTRASSRTRFLQRAGIRTCVAPLDDATALTRGMAGCDLVFHVAGAVDFADDWDYLRHVNVRGTQNVVAAARAAHVRRLVHTSSIVTLGATQDRSVLDETAPWNLAPLRVAYVTTKWEAEQAALATNGGVETVVVNPSSVIGPEDHGPSEFGLLCQRFWKGRIPLHFVGGTNFVDVRDVAAGEMLAAEHGRPGRRYFLGGENLTYRDFFAQLARVVGRTIARVQLPAWLAPLVARLVRAFSRSRPVISPAQARLMGWFFYASPRRAVDELGYCPRPLVDSLADTYHSLGAERADRGERAHATRS